MNWLPAQKYELFHYECHVVPPFCALHHLFTSDNRQVGGVFLIHIDYLCCPIIIYSCYRLLDCYKRINFASKNYKYKKIVENYNEIINGEQLTLVDFFATWCGPCKMMHPVLAQLKDEFGDSIRIIKVDVDKNESLSMNYRIQSVPTLMLFRKGEVLWRQSGAMPLSDLKALISQFQ